MVHPNAPRSVIENQGRMAGSEEYDERRGAFRSPRRCRWRRMVDDTVPISAVCGSARDYRSDDRGSPDQLDASRVAILYVLNTGFKGCYGSCQQLLKELVGLEL